MHIRLPKNWKNPTKLLIFFAAFYLVGCSAYTMNVRPSFDNDYEGKSSRNSSKTKDTSESADESKEKTQKTEETPSKKISDGKIKKTADKYLGSPYRYGGTTKRGFDCSGFVWRVYQDAGFTNFPRETSQAMYNRGKSVSQNSAREGDLVFFCAPKNRKRIEHVGIYINNGQFIHSSSSKGIIYSKLTDNYWKDGFAGIKRLLP